jgi:hypothetical protein
MAGVSTQVQEDGGHVWIVGKGALTWVEEDRMANRLGERHADLMRGRTNIKRAGLEIKMSIPRSEKPLSD